MDHVVGAVERRLGEAGSRAPKPPDRDAPVSGRRDTLHAVTVSESG